ncbi:MAG: hypothetical protein WCL32_22720, partial [Planctomycetota bacterium]
MAGESLQDFDEQLCDYVIGNIRNAARPPRQRRRKSSKPDQGVGPNEFAAWLKANLSAPLASLIFEEVFELGNPTKDGPQRILLNDDEFDALALAVFADVPELDRFWEPDDELHRRHVLCVPEIRRHISDSAAKQWCSDSDEFAEALSEERLHLCDGIEIVKRWTRRLRRLLVAMGADDLVPRPVGNHPTPTTSERAASGQKVPPHLME